MKPSITRYIQRRQRLKVDELDLVRRDFASRFDKLKPNDNIRRRVSSRTSLSTLASSFNGTLSINRAEEFIPREDGEDWIKDRWQVLMEDAARW